MVGELDGTQIEDLLRKQILGRIGCHAYDTTFIVPINYVYDGIYIYAHSRDGMKIKMMRKNPSVCFEVEDIVNNANWQSVIAWGEFEEITDNEEREKIMERLVKDLLPVIVSESALPSHGLGTLKSAIVYRIRLTKKVGKFEQS